MGIPVMAKGIGLQGALYSWAEHLAAPTTIALPFHWSPLPAWLPLLGNGAVSQFSRGTGERPASPHTCSTLPSPEKGKGIFVCLFVFAVLGTGLAAYWPPCLP